MGSQESNIDRLLGARAKIDEELRRRRVSLTVLFTDVVGSTAYFDRYGDTAGVVMLHRHAELASAAVGEFRGHVIKTIGDSVMAEFPEPALAVRAAIQMQRHLMRLNQSLPERERVQFRVGINHGPAFREENDIYGDAVNLASRITKLTGPGQILISRPVREALESEQELRCNWLAKVAIEGKAEKEDIFEVIWTETATYLDLRADLTAAVVRGELLSPGMRLEDFLPAGKPSAPEQPQPRSTPRVSQASPAAGTKIDEAPTATLGEALPATQRFGPYEILGIMGEGGMGIVYKARDTRLDRMVALKLLSATQREDTVAYKRLLREARAAARLDHPNICTVYSIEEIDGSQGIAMQLVEGQSLKEMLAQGPIPLDKFFAITLQVAAGLEQAHRREIIHRDIKPSNIMVTADGQVKILDFGIAHLSAGGAETQMLTAPGTTSGTLAYMAPEQLRGEPSDARSDIFSLGVVMYELLANQPPFLQQTPAATMHALLTTEPKPLPSLRPEVRPDLASVVTKALAKNPAERYQSAYELFADLEKLSTEFVPAERRKVLPVLHRRVLHLSWQAALGAGLLVAALVGGATWWRGHFWSSNATGSKPEAVRSAQVATRPAVPTPSTPIAGKPSVAALAFSNLNHDPKFAHLEVGVADAFADAFVRSGRFRLVERAQLDNALKELKFSQTEFVDPATAQRIGRMIGAEYLVIGSFQVWERQLRLNARLLRVETGEIVDAKKVTGPMEKALELPDQLAQEFLSALPQGVTGGKR